MNEKQTERLNKLTLAFEQYLPEVKFKPDRGRQIAKCPIHNGATETFILYPKNASANGQTFNCVGCGAEGSLLDFVINVNKYDVDQALDHLEETQNKLKEVSMREKAHKAIDKAKDGKE